MSDQPAPTLTVHDRCDCCPAQAYVRVTGMTFTCALLFCGHHWKQHQPKLATMDILVTDELWNIDAGKTAKGGGGFV